MKPIENPTPSADGNVEALIDELRARTTAHTAQNPEGSVDLNRRAADMLERLVTCLDEMNAHAEIVEEREAALASLIEKITEIKPPQTLWFEEAGGYQKHEAQVREIIDAGPELALDERDLRMNHTIVEENKRLQLVHAGQARLALAAVFLADTDNSEEVQAFVTQWRNENRKVIRAEEREALRQKLRESETTEKVAAYLYRLQPVWLHAKGMNAVWGEDHSGAIPYERHRENAARLLQELISNL